MAAPIWHANCTFAFERAQKRQEHSGVLMNLPILTDHRSYCDAADLMAQFGPSAGLEAAARADRSRTVGNHITFCHWRQIERMIVLLSVETPVGTVH